MVSILLENDAELLLQWRESDWIRQNKTYPNDDTPPIVLAARRQIFALPSSEQDLLPQQHLSVLEFLDLPLPTQPARLVFEKAATAFRDEPHTESLYTGAFKARPIPPTSFIRKLEVAAGQAWFNGAQSVVDTRYKQSRLPLYVLTYWREMARVLEKREKWQLARKWFTRWGPTVEPQELVDSVEKLLNSLAWNGDLRALGAASTTDTLSILLSDNWLDDELIDMSSTYLARRLCNHPTLAKGSMVLTLAFQHSILAAYGGRAVAEPGLVLERIKTAVLNEGKKMFYFPVNIDNAHWLAFRMDIDKRTICYGQYQLLHTVLGLGSPVKHVHAGDSQVDKSMSTKPSRACLALIKAIQTWSRRELKIDLQNGGNSLAHGVQTDSNSCGICTINTIAHNLFGDALFHQKISVRMRMELFQTLTGAQLEYDMERASTRATRRRADSDEAVSDERPRKRAAPTLGSRDVLDADENITRTSEHATSTPVLASSKGLLGWPHDELAGRKSPSEASMLDSLRQLSTPSSSVPCSPLRSISSLPDTPSSITRSISPQLEDSTVRVSMHASTMLVEAIPAEALAVGAQSEDVVVETVPHSAPRNTTGGPVGISQSAMDAQRVKISLLDGTFEINNSRMNRFLDEIALLDPYAEVREDSKRRWQVWHSRCAAWYTMQGPYSVARFRKHVNEACKAMVEVAKQTKKQKTSESTSKTATAQSSRSSQPSGRTSTLLSWAERLEWKKESKLKTSTSIGDVVQDGRSDSEMMEVEEEQHERPLLHTSVSSRVWTPSASTHHPCAGLTKDVDDRITIYLSCTFVSGAGSRSVTVLAKELYGQSYGDLSTEDKGVVDNVQLHERSWRNDHQTGAVFSTSCYKFLTPASTHASGPESFACGACLSVLNSAAFKVALRKSTNRKPDVQYKHVNKKYQNETLGRLFARSHGIEPLVMKEDPEASAFGRLAVGILEGRLSGYPLVGDLMRALAQVMDRQTRGVGMQNFKYGPALMEFANMSAIMSPQLYRILTKHMPLPTLRHLRRTQNATPQFPMDVCEKTFDAVEQYLKAVNYTGPIALSCDDTKLHPAFRTYWDASKQVHMLVGGTGEPCAVADAEELTALLADSTAAKATKIRVWCAQVPLPKVPPIIVAARAIPNSLTVSDLHNLVKPILNGLLARNIPVRSYACDGTETERSLQRVIIQSADYRITYAIPHPLGAPLEPLVVVIAFYSGHAVVMIQDSKHALKTYRNNLYSGARLLVIGNDVAMYGWARLLAFLEDSPLYNRDVEKVDRQDDNAATRLFSATTLEYLSSHHPERVAQIVYLFVMGELVDAYQNRHISHLERVKMVLRARFFLDTWRAYLKSADYPESRYFISREAADISNILVDGLIGLIIVYRDYLGEATTTPLCPWLHSSEVCEHVFAECRKLVKDFTFLDFLYMIPRLHVLLRSIVRFTHSSDPKARASGYAHSYFDVEGIDLGMLAAFPTDDEIQQAARDAWAEAESLFSLVGIIPADFLPTAAASSSQAPTSAHLPSISSWFPAGDDPLAHPLSSPAIPSLSTAPPPRNAGWLPGEDSDLDGDDEDYLPLDDDDDSDSNEDDSARLENLIHQHEDDFGRTHAEDDRFLNLSCAAVALALNDTVTIQTSSDISEDLQAQQYDTDRAEIQRAFEEAAQRLLNQLPPEIALPFDRPSGASGSYDDIDYTSVTTARRRHETKRAAKCVRTGKSTTVKGDAESNDAPGVKTSVNDSSADSSPSRRDLLRQLNAIVRQQDGLEQGVGTGLERRARWGSTGKEPGNSANAALAAGQRAATVLTHRLKAFSKHGLPYAAELADALIGVPSPQKATHSQLSVGTRTCYGLVYVDSRILIGRVLAIYSRDGGKNGKHSWRESVPHIGHVSYIAVQLYEQVHATQFRGILRRMAPFQTFAFALIPADSFLQLLPGVHSLSPDRRTLTLDSSALPLLQALQKPVELSKLALAIKMLKALQRRSRRNKASAGEDDRSGSEDGR